MAGTLTLVGQGLALDFLFDTTAVVRPTAWFVALHTGANGGAGAANEIPSGQGYVRQGSVYVRTGNQMANTALLIFGPNTVSNWGSVTDVTVWDAVTGGRCIAQGAADATVTYTVGGTATIAAYAQLISIN